MKTVIFGGTFDPFHIGHMRLARTVIDNINPDRFIIIPNNVTPKKSGLKITPASDRLEMCRLAAKELKAEVSDYEIKKGGPSYTADTLEYFHDLYPSDRLYFAMGSDALKNFLSWKNHEKIIMLSGIICCCRDEKDREDCIFIKNEIETLGGECVLMSVPALSCSSSELRYKIKNNQPIGDLIPESVEKYIGKRGLYRD